MDETTTISICCPFCHNTTELVVPFEGYKAWQSGELVQNALPELSVDDREMLISGTCETCWDELFKIEDEDDVGVQCNGSTTTQIDHYRRKPAHDIHYSHT